MAITLSKYKEDEKLTYAGLAERIDPNLSEWTVRGWCNAGATVKTKGKTILAVFRPFRSLWESEEYKQNSDKNGVAQ